MELEAITRQEQIIAGKDLQPVTRMEFFLKAYGGGGSGGGVNFDGLVRTFDYHFKDYTLYKTLYRDNGAQCFLDMCGNFILPEPNSVLFGFDGEIGFSKVVDIGPSSCFVSGLIFNENGTTENIHCIFGTNASEMEQLAAAYGYTLTTNPNA